MKKRLLVALMSMTLCAGLLMGCGEKEQTSPEVTEAVQETVAAEDANLSNNPSEDVDGESVEIEEEFTLTDDVTIRVASLKGPTSMGLVKLWDDADNGVSIANYEHEMYVGADEIMPLLLQGDVDIALLPANAAANLYQKSQGKIAVIDINTLGVLYMVTADDSVSSITDLKGKTIYLTGKGTTPDLALQFLLKANDVDLSEVTLEYKSEATEVAVSLANDETAVGLLPQPFVTGACTQNENLQIVIDVNAEWEAVNDGNGLVTGVTVVRKDFLEEHPNAVDAFLWEHAESVAFVNDNVEEAAQLVATSGIVEKAPIAQKALPNCNIVCIKGEEMKTALSAYLNILYEQDATFIGGALPEDDFYEVR